MRWYCTLLAGCLACGSDPSSIPNPDDDARFVTVSGSVLDSVLGEPVPGIRVIVGDSLVTTDDEGRFSTRHRGGLFPLAITDHRFEPLEQIERFDSFKTFILHGRGVAPYIMGCSFGPDSVYSQILDLQGRKTINRRSGSYLTLRAGAQIIQRDAYSWVWNPVNTLTWRTAAPLTAAADTVDWRIEDADGNARTLRCLRATSPPPCDSCGGQPGRRRG
jgi:hypothetical protein